MNFAKPATPFPTFGYFGPDYFCDRETEMQELMDGFRGNQPMLLSGIRRLGKTGLLHHFIHHLGKGEVGIYVDLQDASNLRDTVAKISEAILRAYPAERKYRAVWDTIKKLRPSISFDEFSGLPQVSLSISSEKHAEQSLSGLLDALSSRPERIALIFDEFQQIIHFDDQGMESVFRKEMQRHPNLFYIFSGSKTHLLSRIFQEAGRPFYGMVHPLHLSKLDPEVYKKFIQRSFHKIKKKVDEEVVDKAVEWSSGHTYYTQVICNQLYLTGSDRITHTDLLQCEERIIKSQTPDFFQIRDLLSPGQWKTLVAVSCEKKLYHPNAQETVQTYQLGNTTGIRKALAVLMDKQLIHQEFDKDGEKCYQASNPFLANWIRMRRK